MINGLRLQEALFFQKAYVEKSLWEISSQLLHWERSLNSLRVDEILGWNSAREGKINDRRDTIITLGNVIDMKLSRGEEAITKIKNSVIQLGELRVQKKNSEIETGKFLVDLKKQTKLNQEKVLNDSEIVEIKKNIQNLDNQFSDTSLKYFMAKENNPSIINRLDNDVAFQYLFKRGYGTTDYKANGIIAKLDHWLATKIDYVRAVNLYQSAFSIEFKYDDFVKNYETKKIELTNDLQNKEEEIVQELDELRFSFSTQKNEYDEIDKKIKFLYEKMKIEKSIVYSLVINSNNELQENYEALIKFLAQEKAGAEVKLLRYESPEIIVAKNKAHALREERLKLSDKVDNLRISANLQYNRINTINGVLTKLKNRNWLAEDTNFDLNEHSKFFIDMTFGDVDVDTAWNTLKSSYRTSAQIMEVIPQENFMHN